MQVQELRIGNLCYVKNHKQTIFEVTSIRRGLVGVMGGPCFDAEYNELTPIPLTPEILEAAGFEKINDFSFVNKRYVKYDIVLVKSDKRFIVNLTGAFGMVIIKSLYYVHSLQNLIHSLTGKELTVRIPTPA